MHTQKPLILPSLLSDAIRSVAFDADEHTKQPSTQALRRFLTIDMCQKIKE